MGLQPIRARCGGIRYFPDPLGIDLLCDKLNFEILVREHPKLSPWGKVLQCAHWRDRGCPGGSYCPGCVFDGAVPSFVCSFVAATFPQGEGSAPPEAIRQIPICTSIDTEQGKAVTNIDHLCTHSPQVLPAAAKKPPGGFPAAFAALLSVFVNFRTDSLHPEGGLRPRWPPHL